MFWISSSSTLLKFSGQHLKYRLLLQNANKEEFSRNLMSIRGMFSSGAGFSAGRGRRLTSFACATLGIYMRLSLAASHGIKGIMGKKVERRIRCNFPILSCCVARRIISRSDKTNAKPLASRARKTVWETRDSVLTNLLLKCCSLYERTM